MSSGDKIIKAATFWAKICGGWFALMSGGISAFFGLCGFLSTGHDRKIYVFTAFAATWALAIKAIWKNFQLERTELEVEFINPKEMDVNYYHWPLRVKVSHTNPVNTITNVKVFIEKIECRQLEDSAYWLPVKKAIFPIYLPEFGCADNLKSHNLAPKPYRKTFDVLMVRANYSKSMLCICPLKQHSGQRDYYSDCELQLTQTEFPTGTAKIIITLQVTADEVKTLSKTVSAEISIYVFKPGADVAFDPISLPRWVELINEPR
ncbi:MAG TPA: hypothetical protein VGI03_11025 [Verrucomicrobiae bacterium]|jgi:hypothetical protein